MKNLVILSFILALSHCKNTYDDTDAFKRLEVPPYTETGANTFGCLINGAVWANFGATYVHQAESLGGHLDTNKVHSSIYWDYPKMDSVFSIRAALTLSKKGMVVREEIISIYIPKNGTLKGIHQLTSNNYQFEYSNWATNTDYYSIIRNPFIVTVKKDTIESGKHIVSGTFNGILYNNAQTDSLRVTAGIFDIALN